MNERGGTIVGKTKCPNDPAPFASDDELLDGAIQMFRARGALVDADELTVGNGGGNRITVAAVTSGRTYVDQILACVVSTNRIFRFDFSTM
jgi:hypothetical protein